MPEVGSIVNKLKDHVHGQLQEARSNIESIDKQQIGVRGNDYIRERLEKIFSDKTGEAPDKEEIDKVTKDAKWRFERKIPPGFEDDKSFKDTEFFYKGNTYNNKFGDVYIWKQILSKANDENIKNIVFVTDDAKKGWWEIVESRGKKHLGPRAELKDEIGYECDVEHFLMYGGYQFLKGVNEYLAEIANKNSISEVENSFHSEPDGRGEDVNGRVSELLALIEKIDKSIKRSSTVQDIYRLLNYKKHVLFRLEEVEASDDSKRYLDKNWIFEEIYDTESYIDSLLRKEREGSRILLDDTEPGEEEPYTVRTILRSREPSPGSSDPSV